ncbi:TetR/AcrR family transcriptional regulator [Spirosoma taeanense]|uniref:TetR/AcrR family transcriptional regulator n=1 Tax=Spirosoma taeanense TaxID=2735870 RepID=A0A6M5Y8Z1_9BACT|nr:TetR/AcrR family transcriptional regulator [Spirosoma taeanense]QJW89964.1 TetR/AcrR family transcriptional regulator [Spirosoma taeanense]
MIKQKRNRAATTQRIVDALEELMAQRGLDGVGINLIAEKAEVSKVLIYRYFGSLDGLLDYYVRTSPVFAHYSPAVLDQLYHMHQGNPASIWSAQALQLFKRFRASKAAREVLKARVIEQDTLADVVSQAQDEEMTKMVDQLTFSEGADHRALSAIVMGGLSYLTILAQNNREMIGINLRSEAGWQRVEKAVKQIFKAIEQSPAESSPIPVAISPLSLVVEDW